MRFVTDEVLLEFVLGMIVARLYLTGVLKPHGAPVGWILIVSGGLGLCLGIAYVGQLPQVALLDLPAAAIVMGCVVLEQAGSVREDRFSLLLGDASYSIYLFNLFPMALQPAIWRVLKLPTEGWLAAGLYIAAAMAAGTCAGIAAYVIFERPLHELAHRLRAGPHPRARRAAAQT